MSFLYELRPNNNLKVIGKLQKGLVNTGRAEEWGLNFFGAVWPSVIPVPGKVVSETRQIFIIIKKNFVYSRVNVSFALLNERGTIISTTSGDISNNFILSGERAPGEITDRISQGKAVFNPKIDDITDKLTVKVTKVLGKTEMPQPDGRVRLSYVELKNIHISTASLVEKPRLGRW